MTREKSAVSQDQKRTLVRWNEDLDQQLLLSIQSTCNENNVRIPWAKVAETMANNTTEGSIVQHLSKIRTRRIQAGKPVPPTLKRGNQGRRGTTTPISANGGVHDGPRRGPRRRGACGDVREGTRRRGGRGARGGRVTRNKTRNARAASTSDDEYDGEASEHSSSENANESGPNTRNSRRHHAGKQPRVHPQTVLAQTAPSQDNGAESPDHADDDEWVDEEYHTDDTTTDRILVPNADFLNYPNDQESPPTPAIPKTGSGSAQSRIVILNYGRNRVAAVQAITGQSTGIDESPDHQPTAQDTVVDYPDPEQNFMDQYWGDEHFDLYPAPPQEDFNRYIEQTAPVQSDEFMDMDTTLVDAPMNSERMLLDSNESVGQAGMGYFDEGTIDPRLFETFAGYFS